MGKDRHVHQQLKRTGYSSSRLMDTLKLEEAEK